MKTLRHQLRGYDVTGLIAVVDLLNHLAEGGKPLYEYTGICDNATTVYQLACEDDEELQGLIASMSVQWDSFSGDYFFPVGVTGMGAEEAYHSLFNKWEGEYGENRRRLAGFLAHKIEGMLGAI